MSAPKSQAQLMGEICQLTDRLIAARWEHRNKKSHATASEVQRLTRQRSELQAQLNKPRVVWSAQ